MNNTERIQEFLEDNKKFLTANEIDVAHSVVNDEWFVYNLDREYGYYEYFIKFKTVEDLIDIILKEMAFKLRCSIDEQTSTPDCEDDPELADRIERYRKDGKAISDLTACLDRILESELAKDVDFFTTLKSLINYNATK